MSDDFVPEGTEPTAGQTGAGQTGGAHTGGVPNPSGQSAGSNPGVTVPDDLSGLDQAGPAPTGDADQVAQMQALVAERTADLQRLQAEYVNYKRRVDRDREVSRAAGAEKVLSELLPTLDAIVMADEHGELTGGFKMVADQLQKITEKHGLVAFGAVGDEFDPHRHEALMHQQMPGATTTCVSAVMQQGYQLNDRIVRPARVAVSDPDPDAAASN